LKKNVVKDGKKCCVRLKWVTDWKKKCC